MRLRRPGLRPEPRRSGQAHPTLTEGNQTGPRPATSFVQLGAPRCRAGAGPVGTSLRDGQTPWVAYHPQHSPGTALTGGPRHQPRELRAPRLPDAAQKAKGGWLLRTVALPRRIDWNVFAQNGRARAARARATAQGGRRSHRQLSMGISNRPTRVHCGNPRAIRHQPTGQASRCVRSPTTAGMPSSSAPVPIRSGTCLRDGREVHSWLLRPQGSPPPGGWPLLLWIHGGPLGAWNDGWH